MPDWVRNTLIAIALAIASAWGSFVFSNIQTLQQRATILETMESHWRTTTDQWRQIVADNQDISRARINDLEKELIKLEGAIENQAVQEMLKFQRELEKQEQMEIMK